MTKSYRIRTWVWLAVLAIVATTGQALAAEDAAAKSDLSLEQGFRQPPDAARPWVYWFWLNGNITREGITADLEAMKRVGIGGVLIMEVDQGAPVGPVDFMGPQWRELFKHVHAEAQAARPRSEHEQRRRLERQRRPVDQARAVHAEGRLDGNRRRRARSISRACCRSRRPPPDFYRDIAVLAFPAVGDYRIPDIEAKAAFQRRGGHKPAKGELSPGDDHRRRRASSNLTRADGRRRTSSCGTCRAGKWTILRFGHTSTGAENAPAPKTGRGLECDKLSKEGIEANFAGMMAKLAADTGIDRASARRPAWSPRTSTVGRTARRTGPRRCARSSSSGAATT